MARSDKKHLRIAMLGHKRIPSREGGIEIVVTELAVRMANIGHSVTCYNRQGHHVSGSEFDAEQLDEYKGVRLKSVFAVDKRGISAVTASVSAAVRSAFGKYDAVHFHAEGPCAMMWLPKLFGKRCIATVHGLDHQRSKWGKFALWYIRLGEKCAVRLADEIIVLSRSVQEYFKREYNRETVYIPNGIEKALSVEAEQITQRFGLTKDSYILYLGRLVPEKGITYLIDAFKQLKTDKKLVIAGGSSDTEDYENEIRSFAKNDDRILFTGFVEGELLAELYSNSYVYVLPSDLEGMSMSLLEAMSYGNCCLTSDIAESVEVTEDKGVSFKKGDVSDLKDKLQYLFDNPDKVYEYKAKSADFVCTKYNWDDVVHKTLELYGVNEESNEDPVGK